MSLTLPSKAIFPWSYHDSSTDECNWTFRWLTRQYLCYLQCFWHLAAHKASATRQIWISSVDQPPAFSGHEVHSSRVGCRLYDNVKLWPFYSSEKRTRPFSSAFSRLRELFQTPIRPYGLCIWSMSPGLNAALIDGHHYKIFQRSSSHYLICRPGYQVVHIGDAGRWVWNVLGWCSSSCWT